MRYLFGDSTESDLEFDYLAFLREVIDCAVVMVECEVTLAVTVEGRRSRELETASVVAAVEELGRRASQLVDPAAGDQPTTPVGRCAVAIAAAIREAVDKESQQARAALAVECDEMDRQDQRQRGRARGVLEKLLRTHDLPGAERTLEVAWTAAGVKATLRERTGFGVEGVIALDIPAGSVLGLDLRVDKIAESVEVHAHETAGWLKKSDKVVAHKLGRYQVASVLVAADATIVRLRMAPDASAGGFVVTSRHDGELHVEPTGGGPGREVAVDDRNRPGLRLLVERLETAARALAENRSGLVSLDIDGTPIAQYEHPRVFAERLIAAVAPTVQKIMQRSRSPGELVLRRLLGDSRREEIFVSTADLSKRLDGLPSHAREAFAPLHLGGEPARAPLDEPRHPARAAAEARPAAIAAPAPAFAPAPAPLAAAAPAATPAPAERVASAIDRRFDTESEARAEPRHLATGRTMPPPAPMPEGRGGASRLPSMTSAGEAKRSRPTPPRGESAFGDLPMFEDRSPPHAPPRTDLLPRIDAPPRGDPTPHTPARPSGSETRPPATASRPAERLADVAGETGRQRVDDSALSDAIDRALDDSDSTPAK